MRSARAESIAGLKCEQIWLDSIPRVWQTGRNEASERSEYRNEVSVVKRERANIISAANFVDFWTLAGLRDISPAKLQAWGGRRVQNGTKTRLEAFDILLDKFSAK